MAKSINQKLKIFHLRNILLENTDKNHYMTMNEILESLENIGIKAERKSIYSDIDLLREMGFEIVNQKRLGYAVVKKDFDIAEISIIIKALNNANIMESKRKHIVSKLENFLSKYEVREIIEEKGAVNRI